MSEPTAFRTRQVALTGVDIGHFSDLLATAFPEARYYMQPTHRQKTTAAQCCSCVFTMLAMEREPSGFAAVILASRPALSVRPSSTCAEKAVR